MIKLYKNNIKVDKFDFNTLANVIDQTNSKSIISSNYLNHAILDSCFQLKEAHHHPFFKDAWEALEKQYNPTGSKKSSIDIFFSFCAGGRSIAHKDFEDVCIFGLYGKTIYLINNKEYPVLKGDLLFIPNNTIHRAVGITPRIIASYGTW